MILFEDQTSPSEQPAEWQSIVKVNAEVTMAARGPPKARNGSDVKAMLAFNVQDHIGEAKLPWKDPVSAV